jgi:hypothetical protein
MQIEGAELVEEAMLTMKSTVNVKEPPISTQNLVETHTENDLVRKFTPKSHCKTLAPSFRGPFRPPFVLLAPKKPHISPIA